MRLLDKLPLIPFLSLSLGCAPETHSQVRSMTAQVKQEVVEICDNSMSDKSLICDPSHGHVKGWASRSYGNTDINVHSLDEGLRVERDFTSSGESASCQSGRMQVTLSNGGAVQLQFWPTATDQCRQLNLQEQWTETETQTWIQTVNKSMEKTREARR